MKRFLIHFLGGFLALLCAIGLHACGGTETGNPARNPADGSGNPHANPAITLVDGICRKLTSCLDALNESECLLPISASTTLAKEFGVEGDHPFIDVLFGAEGTDLPVNTEALTLCVTSINDLRCDDETIQAIRFQDGTVENLDQMIPDEGCPEVFSGPSRQVTLHPREDLP
jgi:hypothetical protein